jgi:Reverse transcriptase (RNA-dependent DNA polymerase)
MERVIVNEMLCFMRTNNVITKHQHGFLSGRSATSNLLETINDWTHAVNAKHSVSFTYIDFKLASDRVSHPKLLVKLQSYGISAQLLG